MSERELKQEWVVARDRGMWLVGLQSEVEPGVWGGVLAPVYELHVQVQQQGQGMAVNYGAQPLLLIASMDRWDLYTACQVWPVKGMSVEKHIMNAVERAEQMAVQMRAASAGISLANQMPKARVGR